MRTVAALGLGAMGLPMAKRLASGGFTVRGYDPWPARRRLAEAEGVATMASPADTVAGADVVLLAVRDGAQAAQALFGDPGTAPADQASGAADAPADETGRAADAPTGGAGGAADALADGAVVVLTSTIGADAAIALSRRLTPAGAAMVDAPVSGGAARAEAGDLLVLAAGTDPALERARPVLEHVASTLTVVGPRVGDGQLVKVINQLLAGVHIAAAAEAIALAKAAGLDPAIVVDVLSAGAAGSFMLTDRGPRMLQALGGDPEVKSRVDIFVKDMGLVADLAGSAAVPTPVASAARQLYLLAARAGLGALDDSSIVRLLAVPEDAR